MTQSHTHIHGAHTARPSDSDAVATDSRSDLASPWEHAPPAYRPDVVGRWQLLEQIGEGRFARIFRAHPAGKSPEQADYAVKLLRVEHEDDADAVEMMIREAVVGSMVSSPHVVPVLDAGVEAAPYFVVQPLLVGASLADMLDRHRSIAVPHALWIARQAASGLACLHEQGWLHGDVSPANILVGPDGHATLLDLGFARKIERPGKFDDRPVPATPRYMAPELATATHRAGGRSDVYSLGTIVFEMLSGVPAVAGESTAEVISAHKSGPSPELRAICPHLPGPVCRIVRHMLCKQPLRRPEAEELVRRLCELEINTLEQRLSLVA